MVTAVRPPRTERIPQGDFPVKMEIRKIAPRI
jgi:hypothetical protein